MLILKTNPVGIDFIIQKLQTHIHNEIENPDHNAYGRVYKNQTESGMVPEHYIGRKNYTEVLNNDKKALTSFFIVSDNITYNEKAEATISYICQVNLKKSFPDILHRADEEFINNVVYSITNSPYPVELNSIVRGLDNVLSEFNRDGLKDMQDFFFVRFDINVIYSYQCF